MSELLLKIVSRFCRLGFTCRCIHAALLGTPSLPGGQAQYIRIPKAGGTLFNISTLSAIPGQGQGLSKLPDSSLLLLADILPTGVFAALETLQHPKLSPMLTGIPYPFNGIVPEGVVDNALAYSTTMSGEDRKLTLAVVGLGPVGIVSLNLFLAPNRVRHDIVSLLSAPS